MYNIIHKMFQKIVKLNKVPKLRLSRWSALEKTFNSRPNRNTDITLAATKDAGLFKVPHLTTLGGFYSLTEECIKKSNQLIGEALYPNRKRKMVEIFDELSDTLCQVADLAEFIRFAHPSNDYSKAAENASVSVSGIVEKLNTNIELYRVLRDTVLKGDLVQTTDEDRYVGQLFLFDFEQSGIHLNERQREQVVKLNNYILYLGQSFVNGVAIPKPIDRTALPDSIRDVFSSPVEKIVIYDLYADSSSPLMREAAYRIYLHPDSQQEKLLSQLLSARHDLAQICGFRTYSERALRGSILETPDNVMALIDKLRDRLKDKVVADFADMCRLKKQESPDFGDLAAWDVPYFTHKMKKERFEVSEKGYSPYFSLGACMEGLNLIFQSLYGISLLNSDIEPGETWSKDVYKLAVTHETEGLLGYIYCDFYERHSKPNQDCHFTIKGGRRLPNGSYQLPIVVLMLNFSLPRWSSPTLLLPSMVDNLFHEMGHAMHSMLARTRYQHVSGTRCSTDFAEVPSILMEYFASDPRVLKLFAKHFQTKESMPDDMLYRLCASKRLFIASETQLQNFYAALDQIYHGPHPLEGNLTDVLQKTQNLYYSLPYVKSTTWHLRFSHLVGYGGKYYSYIVSRALAHLIWQSYFQNDPLSRNRGEKYRNECLSYGGSKHPRKLISDFLNLEPTPDVLAKSIIDEIDDNQKQIDDISEKLGVK